VLSALAGFAMGAVNGAALPADADDRWLFALGVGALTLLATAFGVALASLAAERSRLARLFWRIAGSWIAALGAIMAVLSSTAT
jgi:hypothetical protein